MSLQSQRPVRLCETMIGRQAAIVPAAFERLFALCGRSHRIAAEMALAAARGQETSPAERHAALRALAAERLGEHLRSTVTTATAAGTPATAAELQSLRTTLAATRPDAPTEHLEAALAALGLAGPAPPPASWAARMLDAAGPPEAGAAPDALTAADDQAVLAALQSRGPDYAARPDLPQRRPETGPLARADGAVTPRSRLQARFTEVAQAAAILLNKAPPAPAAWTASLALSGRTGFAAVETPRGRMHHLISLDAQDRVAGCVVLAPTEWNFHPDGPFVHALRGLRAGAGAAARIRWLIGLFDPCVACALDLQETAHA